MAPLDLPDAPTGTPPVRHPNSPDDDSRRGFASWWASWRVAVRMARRDVRRHGGRSALILVMIGLPVMLITVGATLATTSDLTPAEAAPFAYGSGAAMVHSQLSPQRIEQSPVPRGWATASDAPTALPVPGLTADPAAAIGRLLGGTAVPFGDIRGRAQVDGRGQEVVGLSLRLTDSLDLGLRAHLLTGRWPRSEAEVVVTRHGAARGLPTSGTVTLVLPATDDGPRERRVVGTADAVVGDVFGPLVRPADLVVPLTSEPSGWLVTDRGDLSWPEVQRLNGYGLLVGSRALALLPDDQLPLEENTGIDDARAQGMAIAAAAAAAGLLFTSALLAGPAFAVSASRQRRTLALVTANGATRAQVRRMLLGQSLVLGVLAATVGLGLGLGLFALAGAARIGPLGGLLYFPADVPWPLLSSVAVSAVVSAVFAALVPARGLGRADLVGSMRGREVSPPLRRRLVAVGLGLVGVGSVVVLTQTEAPQGLSVTLFLVGSGLLMAGALCLVPALLVLTSRHASRLPVSARLAARDAGRQRSRTGPTAAVMASAALLSAASIAIASDTALRADTYRPQLGHGMGSVVDDDATDTAGRGDISALEAAVRAVDPSLWVLHPAALADPRAGFGPLDPQTAATPTWRVVAMRSGCTPQAALENPYGSGPDAHCSSVSSEVGGGGQSIGVLPAAEMARLLDLDETAARLLSHGAMVVPDPATRPDDADTVAVVDVIDGHVTLAAQQQRLDPDTGEPISRTTATTVTLPALVVPWSTFARVHGSDTGAALSRESVTARGWPVAPMGLWFVDPEGPVSQETEQRLRDGLDQRTPGSYLYVERGFQRSDLPVVLAVLGIITLLILVATFVSTALSLAEQQSFMGTLAAVGATRGTRRRLAAAQALHVAGLGVLVGATAGLVPGVAVARATTSRVIFDGTAEQAYGPFVVVPWLQILAPMVAIPLVAAGAAWLFVRRAPTVSRRLT